MQVVVEAYHAMAVTAMDGARGHCHIGGREELADMGGDVGVGARR